MTIPFHLSPLMNLIRKAGLLSATLACALLMGGCSSLEPWVKPYERERLADPVMSPSRGELSDRHVGHVRAVREGSRGATGVQGGGCGCN